MIEELIRQQGQLQRQVDNLIKPEVGYDFISPFLGLPGLVGFWPMSSVQRSTGNVYDLSGQSRTLTYNGNPTFNIYNNVVPYIDLDGTGDYLSRADETDLDILGTESWAAVPGFTIGAWYYFNTAGNDEAIASKYGAAGDRTFFLQKIDDGRARIGFSNDGTNFTSSEFTVALSATTWYFVCGRFVPSTSVDVYLNAVKSSTVAGVPASLFNSTYDLRIGRLGGGEQFVTGRITLLFLCANALPDALISSLFAHTRGLFGV